MGFLFWDSCHCPNYFRCNKSSGGKLNRSIDVCDTTIRYVNVRCDWRYCKLWSIGWNPDESVLLLSLQRSINAILIQWEMWKLNYSLMLVGLKWSITGWYLGQISWCWARTSTSHNWAYQGASQNDLMLSAPWTSPLGPTSWPTYSPWKHLTTLDFLCNSVTIG